MVNTLHSQSKLSIAELDSFFTQIITIYDKFTTKKALVNQNLSEGEDSNDINLENKQTTFRNSLNKFETSIKRSLKAQETSSMTELDTWRVKQLNNHIAFIKSFKTDANLTKRNAALGYEPLLEQYKNIYKQTNSAQSATISKYIKAIQGEKYETYFAALELENRTKELKDTNDKYIKLSEERTNEEKNRSESPSSCRQQCVVDYRSLISLINFAETNNSTLFYTDMENELSAQTSKTQELINRRINATKKKEPMTSIMEINKTDDLQKDDMMVEAAEA